MEIFQMSHRAATVRLSHRMPFLVLCRYLLHDQLLLNSDQHRRMMRGKKLEQGSGANTTTTLSRCQKGTVVKISNPGYANPILLLFFTSSGVCSAHFFFLLWRDYPQHADQLSVARVIASSADRSTQDIVKCTNADWHTFNSFSSYPSVESAVLWYSDRCSCDSTSGQWNAAGEVRQTFGTAAGRQDTIDK